MKSQKDLELESLNKKLEDVNIAIDTNFAVKDLHTLRRYYMDLIFYLREDKYQIQVNAIERLEEKTRSIVYNV